MPLSKNGFTLIEVLFSLAILMVIITFFAPSQMTQLNQLKEKQFFELLKYDVLYIQSRSRMYENERVLIRFYADEYRIIEGLNTNEVRPYPAGLSIDTFGKREIYFNSNGTVIQPRTISVYGINKTYQLIFPLGKGRFYIAEI
ncbi:competence type IV pilus minor pilin ComGD [Oceanobacillus kimchii]|uniref:competence type IV pilus minor pilin ComGD n=1 Tax=Oceanobacillus kimchii TaxID=746691 RepID=UPI000986B612|nr:competence type IV pilus minor pilin ComGD [Oceanobacillus kimchii]